MRWRNVAPCCHALALQECLDAPCAHDSRCLPARKRHWHLISPGGNQNLARADASKAYIVVEQDMMPWISRILGLGRKEPEHLPPHVARIEQHVGR